MRMIDATDLQFSVLATKCNLVNGKSEWLNGYRDALQAVLELIDEAPTIEARPVVRPIEEWAEDYGDVLWWRFPIEEPPYVGSPLDCNWSGYHTHWTPIEVPEPPNCGADMRGDDDG